MKIFIAVFLLVFYPVLGYAKDPFHLKLSLRSATLPPTYKIKVKLGLQYEVIDMQNAKMEKKFTPAESDVLFRNKSQNEFQFEVTYASGKPVFSMGDSLEFVIPSGVSVAPKGLVATLAYPFEYEIYAGPRLLFRSKGKFQMPIETALSKQICFRINDEGEYPDGQDVKVMVGVAACDVDFSKAKRMPK